MNYCPLIWGTRRLANGDYSSLFSKYFLLIVFLCGFCLTELITNTAFSEVTSEYPIEFIDQFISLKEDGVLEELEKPIDYIASKPIKERSTAFSNFIQWIGTDDLGAYALLAKYQIEASKYNDAARTLKNALANARNSHRTDTISYALLLNNQARLSSVMGNHEDALNSYWHALTAMKAARSPEDDIVVAINNIVFKQIQLGLTDGTPPIPNTLDLLAEGLSYDDSILPGHRINLFLRYVDYYMGIEKYSDAEKYIDSIKRLAIELNIKNSSTRLKILTTLSEYYMATGRVSEAVGVYDEILEIFDHHNTTKMPFSFLVAKITAHWQHSDNDTAQALLAPALHAFSRELESIQQLESNERIDLLAEINETRDLLISYLMQTNSLDLSIRNQYLSQLVLVTKSMSSGILDDHGDYRKTEDAHDKKTESELRGLVTRSPPNLVHAAYSQLDRHINKITVRPNKSVKINAQQLADSVNNAIKLDQVLVEYLKFTPRVYGFKPTFYRRAKDHYIAVVKQYGQPYTVWDIGLAETIDKTIADYRHQVSSSLKTRLVDISVSGTSLLKQLFPFISSIEDGKKFIVAPDGAINLLPFGALVYNDQYFLEVAKVRYLTSASQLLTNASSKNNQAGSIVFLADPNFEINLNGSKPYPWWHKDSENNRRATAVNINSDARGFLKLFQTASLKQPNIGDLIIYDEEDASETNAKAISSPLIFHASTHGKFISPTISPDSHHPRRDNPRLKRINEIRYASDSMRLSHIQLAGYNGEGGSDLDDGFLSAFEIAGLNMQNTRLATLATCESGLGDVLSGIGVFGLRRGLELAGSDSQLISLWDIQEERTNGIMNNFYTRYFAGERPSDALRNAQLSLISEGIPPYYWAAFMVSGRDGYLF